MCTCEARLADSPHLVPAPLPFPRPPAGLNTAFGCTNLTKDQWIACMLLGASVIPLNVLFHMVPPSLFPSGGGGIPPEDDDDEGDDKKKDD